MPKLGQQQTQKVYLPSTDKPEVAEEDKAWCIVKSRLLLGDVAAINEAGDNPTAQTIAGLSKFITDWNYTDDSGQPVPVSADNVQQLELEDFLFLASKFEELANSSQKGLVGDEKKASSVSSPGTENPTATSQQITISTPD